MLFIFKQLVYLEYLSCSLSSLLWRPRNLYLPCDCIYKMVMEAAIFNCHCDQMQNCEGGCETVYI
jgi:hypothetical protein